MTTIIEELEGELAALRRRHAAQPERELTYPLVLALEREEVVAVGYRGRRATAVMRLSPGSAQSCAR